MGKLIGLGITGVIALVLVLMTSYTIDEGERGVILRTGAVVGVAEPGWHVKIPFIDSVVDMSVRTERADYENVMSYSKDIQASSSLIQVNYHLDPSMVTSIYGELGEEYRARVLDPAVLDETKVVWGRFTASQIVADRQRLGAEVTTAIQNAVAPYGIIIESVQISNIDFSDQFEKSIEDRMQAEVEVQRLEQNLRREQVQADIARTQAAGAADALRAQAEAEAYSIQVRMEAEAEGIRQRGAALRDNPLIIELTQAQTWNGQLPQTMVPGAAIPMLNLPAPR